MYISLRPTADCFGDIGPVRTCHARWIIFSASNQSHPREVVHLSGHFIKFCMWDINTRTRIFCKFCTPCHITWNFWEFCKTVIPVPETYVCFVGHSYPYPELLQVLYARAPHYLGFPEVLEDCHTRFRTSNSSVGHSYSYRNFCGLCTPRATIPGVPGTSSFVSARIFRDFCTPVTKQPELLEVLQHVYTRTRNSWKFYFQTIVFPHAPKREGIENEFAIPATQ